MADKIATREAYGASLAELGEKYDIVVLDADLAEATKTVMFKKKFPERFFDCGISEANMMSVAAGLATAGKIPFVSSFAMFTAGRAFEQVRNSIGYPHLNVKIGATHAGVSVGEDGATHQCNEDIALMRAVPGMTVINPADGTSTRAAVEAAILHNGPVYMRFGRLAVPYIYDDSLKFEIGKGIKLRDGRDITIVSTGLTVYMALEAAKILDGEGISAEVIDMHTIKPLDKELLIASARKTGAVITTEEHSVIGGLGGAVCEALSEACPTPVIRVGVEDVFGKSGKGAELVAEFGLSPENFVQKAKDAIALKK